MSDPFGISKKQVDDKARYGMVGAAIGGAAAGAAMEPQDRVRRNNLVRAKAAEKAQARRIQERTGKVPQARLDVEAGKLLRRKADVSAARKAKYIGRVTPALAAGSAAAGGALLADDLLERRKVKKNDPFEVAKGAPFKPYAAKNSSRVGEAWRAKAAAETAEKQRLTNNQLRRANSRSWSPSRERNEQLRSAPARAAAKADKKVADEASATRRSRLLIGGGVAGGGAVGAGGTLAFRRNQR